MLIGEGAEKFAEQIERRLLVKIIFTLKRILRDWKS